MYFDLSLSGPFSFLSATKSLTDRKKNKGNANDSQEMSNDAISHINSINHGSEMNKTQMGIKEILDMDLIEASNLGLLINFDGYNSKDLKNWPNSKRNYSKGNLEVRFRNGMVQKIELEGQL